MMTEEKLNILKSKLEKYNVEYFDVNGTPQIIVDKDKVIEVCTLLRDDEDLKFIQCVDALGVDRFQKKDRFEMIYNLVSIDYNMRLFVKIKLDTKNPEIESLTTVWKSCDWYEREAYDMVGINFKNHPDPTRMYMPEEFEYYPLRKDFPLMGIPGSLPLPNK